MARGLPPAPREDLRLDGYFEYLHALKALYIYKHPCLLRDSNPAPTAPYLRRGLLRQECFDELNSLYSDKAPAYSNVKNWYIEFNRGRRSIQDEFPASHPKSVAVQETIDAVHELIKQDDMP
ncbi:putative mariner transposase [Trichonephila clavipes]|nr:putative mariner transposase [Trichonephila clavipes]